MHSISEFNQLTSSEKANALSAGAALVITEVRQYTRASYYIYSNFFVEVIYAELEGDPILIDAFKTGPRVRHLLDILETMDHPETTTPGDNTHPPIISSNAGQNRPS